MWICDLLQNIRFRTCGKNLFIRKKNLFIRKLMSKTVFVCRFSENIFYNYPSSSKETEPTWSFLVEVTEEEEEGRQGWSALFISRCLSPAISVRELGDWGESIFVGGISVQGSGDLVGGRKCWMWWASHEFKTPSLVEISVNCAKV